METQKVYVTDDNMAVINCPSCGTAKTVNAGKLKKRGKPLSLRCSCQSVFRVFFEYRKVYRKKANLGGYYAMLPVVSKDLDKMRVDDISINGIGFTTQKKNTLKKGDKIRVTFTLDDKNHSEIVKRGVVRWVNARRVGCKFTEPNEYDRLLGFYMM
jgi:hypothetical protein